MEKYITSRSSPWTFSRFLTNTGSSASSAKSGSITGCWRRASSNRSSISRCCSALKVTTPMVRRDARNAGSFRRPTRSATSARASGWLMRAPPFSYRPSPTRWKLTARSSVTGNLTRSGLWGSGRHDQCRLKSRCWLQKITFPLISDLSGNVRLSSPITVSQHITTRYSLHSRLSLEIGRRDRN